MNRYVKQATIAKLAQMRLAINHVLRNRAMRKYAADPTPAPQFGEEGYIAPEFEYIKRMGEVMDSSPNAARFSVPGTKYNPHSADFYSGVRYPSASRELRRLAERASLPATHPEYLSQEDVDRNMGYMYRAYNGDFYKDIHEYRFPKSNHSEYNMEGLPAWPLKGIADQPNPHERYRAAQKYLLQQGVQPHITNW